MFPYEALLDPGDKQAFTLKLFDAKGNFIRSEPATAAQWTLDLLQGTVGPDGTYVAPASGVGGLRQGDGRRRHRPGARARDSAAAVVSYDFEGMKAAPMWWTANGKAAPGQIDGAGVLVRPRDDTVGRRAKVMMGRPDWSNYTVEADVRGTEIAPAARRRRPHQPALRAGAVRQRAEARAASVAGRRRDDRRVPFAWDVNTWYRMKLRVENRADGTTLVQGKVWPVGQPEPAAWTIQKIDKIPHRNGSPGLYADGISDMHFDNLRVYKNQ